jgi:CBS domain containing-hemolysin-like protein
MRTLSESGNKNADRVLRITNDSGKMLSAILIGNNIVNLSASSIATAFAMKHMGSAGAGVATGVLTFLILVFGEVTPKTKATLHADQMALSFALPVDILMKLFTPLIFIINRLSMGILFLLGVSPDAKDDLMTEEELRTIVDVSQETGVIEHEERDMIHNLFDFGDSEAKEIMVPRIDMTFVSSDAGYREILEIFRADKFTRLPVYEDTTDNVIGILNMKDLLLCEDTEHFSISDIIREPYFTYEHKNTADLFIEMRKNSISIAIVLDEYGATAGLITLEDLLEEIVGEIRDEYDTDEVDAITRLNEREFMVLGSTGLDDVSDALGIELTSENYDTIGGYCLDHLDHLPEKNEIILTDNGLLLRIDKMDKNRIERVYIKLPRKEQTEA